MPFVPVNHLGREGGRERVNFDNNGVPTVFINITFKHD